MLIFFAIGREIIGFLFLFKIRKIETHPVIVKIQLLLLRDNSNSTDTALRDRMLKHKTEAVPPGHCVKVLFSK